MEVLNNLIQSYSDIIDQELVIIILILFIVIFSIKSKRNFLYFKYRSKGTLLSNAEKSFFFILKQSLQDDFEIFSKVRIADVLTPEKGLDPRSWRFAFNNISSKHFDYVLCDKETLSVIAVIELDDKSHNQKKVMRRDAFVNSACHSANLKLVRFPCKSSYQVQSIRDTVLNSLH